MDPIAFLIGLCLSFIYDQSFKLVVLVLDDNYIQQVFWQEKAKKRMKFNWQVPSSPW